MNSGESTVNASILRDVWYSDHIETFVEPIARGCLEP